MSIDKSLVVKGKLTKRRSVLKRTERLKLLKEDGKWKDGESIFGLPKVKVAKIGKK